MIGIELLSQDIAKGKMYVEKIVTNARQEGIILLGGGTYGNVLKLTPPLCIKEQDVEDILSKFDKLFRQLNL